MNREIKFRGKNIDTGEWVYGDLIQEHRKHDNKNFVSETTYIRDLTFYNGDYVGYKVCVDLKTVGQYIGLDDVNNKEIYEGDFIVDNGWDDEPLEVIYDNEDFAFKTKEHIKGREYFWDSRYKNIIDAKCYTIIGNIYDNPELIVK